MNITLGKSLSPKTFGRDIKVDLFESLSKSNNNICLVGISGSGKTVEIENIINSVIKSSDIPIIVVSTHKEELNYLGDKILRFDCKSVVNDHSIYNKILEMVKNNTNSLVIIDTPDTNSETINKLRLDLIKIARMYKAVVITTYFALADVPFDVLVNSKYIELFDRMLACDISAVEKYFGERALNLCTKYTMFGHFDSMQGRRSMLIKDNSIILMSRNRFRNTKTENIEE